MSDKILFKRFIEKVNIVPGECWEWTGAIRSKLCKYGAIKAHGKIKLAHRVSYKLFVGEIPKGMLVCHKCDNSLCVNPDHLFVGTQSDNMKDAYQKGRLDLSISKHTRFKKGHIPANATIAPEKARQVKVSLARGMRPIDVSNKHGVKYGTVIDIKRGKSFRNIVV